MRCNALFSVSHVKLLYSLSYKVVVKPTAQSTYFTQSYVTFPFCHTLVLLLGQIGLCSHTSQKSKSSHGQKSTVDTWWLDSQQSTAKNSQRTLTFFEIRENYSNGDLSMQFLDTRLSKVAVEWQPAVALEGKVRPG